MQVALNTSTYQGHGSLKALSSLFQSRGHPGGNKVQGAADNDGDADGPQPGLPPGGDSQASAMFASDTLGALLQVQQKPTSADIASRIIGKVDTDGDGSLSADEIKAALLGSASTSNPSTAASSASDGFSKAMAKLDTDGDGKLSANELSTAIDGLISRHKHRHHALAEATPTPTPNPSTATDPAATTASTDAAGSNGATTGTAASAGTTAG